MPTNNKIEIIEPISTTQPKEITIACFIDHDSTAVIEGKINQNLLKDIEKTVKSYKDQGFKIKILFISSSNRQSKHMDDEMQSKNKASGSHYPTMMHIYLHFKEKYADINDIECELDPVLLSDTFYESEPGTNFYSALNAHHAQIITELLKILPDFSSCLAEVKKDSNAFKEYNDLLNKPNLKTWPVFLNTLQDVFNAKPLGFLREANSKLNGNNSNNKELCTLFDQIFTLLEKLRISEAGNHLCSLSVFVKAWIRRLANVHTWKEFNEKLDNVIGNENTIHDWVTLLEAIKKLLEEDKDKNIAALSDALRSVQPNYFNEFTQELNKIQTYSDTFFNFQKQIFLFSVKLQSSEETTLKKFQELITKETSEQFYSVLKEYMNSFHQWNNHSIDRVDEKFLDALKNLSENQNNQDAWSDFASEGCKFSNYIKLNQSLILLLDALKGCDKLSLHQILTKEKEEKKKGEKKEETAGADNLKPSARESLINMLEALKELENLSNKSTCPLQKFTFSSLITLCEKDNWMDDFKYFVRAESAPNFLKDLTLWENIYEFIEMPADHGFATVLEKAIKATTDLSKESFEACMSEFKKVKNYFTRLDSQGAFDKANNHLNLLNDPNHCEYFICLMTLLGEPDLLTDFYKMRHALFAKKDTSQREALYVDFKNAIHSFKGLSSDFPRKLLDVYTASDKLLQYQDAATNLKSMRASFKNFSEKKDTSDCINAIKQMKDCEPAIPAYSRIMFASIEISIKDLNVISTLQKFFTTQKIEEKFLKCNLSYFEKLPEARKTLEGWLSNLKLRNNFDLLTKTLLMVNQLAFYDDQFYEQFLNSVTTSNNVQHSAYSGRSASANITCSEILAELRKITELFRPFLDLSKPEEAIPKLIEACSKELNFIPTMKNVIKTLSNKITDDKRNNYFYPAMERLKEAKDCSQTYTDYKKWLIYGPRMHEIVSKAISADATRVISIDARVYDDLSDLINRLRDMARMIPANVRIIPCYCNPEGKIEAYDPILGTMSFTIPPESMTLEFAKCTYLNDKKIEDGSERLVLEKKGDIEFFLVQQSLLQPFFNKLHELKLDVKTGSTQEKHKIRKKIYFINNCIFNCKALFSSEYKAWQDGKEDSLNRDVIANGEAFKFVQLCMEYSTKMLDLQLLNLNNEIANELLKLRKTSDLDLKETQKAREAQSTTDFFKEYDNLDLAINSVNPAKKQRMDY